MIKKLKNQYIYLLSKEKHKNMEEIDKIADINNKNKIINYLFE